METDLNFMGKNIRFFRRSRNWTLAQLSSKIGIREGPLGRIERGLNLPSAAVLYKLTKVFGISADALFTDERSQVQTALCNDSFFVAIDPCPKTPPKNLLTICKGIMTAFHALEDICAVQKHSYLPLSMPFEAAYQGMDKLASRFRNYLGTEDAVVFDYFELFENFGLRIILFPFTRNAKEVDSLSFYEPACHNAFFFLNSRKNPEKQLFSLAVELGKILIFNQMRIRKDPLFPDLPGESVETRPINEARAAKRFAATFLMPETSVRATVGQLGVKPGAWSWELLLRIKHRFGISAETFLYRLQELDLISPDLCEKFKGKIQNFYCATEFSEPDASRRCLNANGRFFDLLLTAENQTFAQKEIADIKKMVKEYKIIKI